MNKNFLRSIVMTAALSAGFVGTAAADQMWDFGSLFSNSQQNTSLGGSYTFTQGSNWVKATAVVPMWTASTCDGSAAQPCLFAKYTSGDPNESGLGLTPAPQNEINYPDGIALQSAANNPILSISLGSVQSTESWAVAGCSSMFMSCTTIDSGVGAGTATEGSVKLSDLGSYGSYIVYVPCATGAKCDGSMTGGSNNILVVSATTSVPEPGALALFGAGLLGCALFVGRRRRSAALRS